MAAEYSYRDPYYAYREPAGVDAKVVVMGNTGVGKTSIVHRYTEGKFTPAGTTSTTGAFFVTKKVNVDGVKVRLQLWDTAGQERFRSMAPMYYRNANAALLVYDITDTKTFDDVRGWLEELKKNCSTDLIIYIVGSKADLHRHRAVTQDRARHSLNTWFPPPRPPSPPPAPPQSNFSYMRPRFIPLPTSSSVPFPSVAPSTPSDSSQSGSHKGLTRSNTTARAYPRISTPALSRSTTTTSPVPRPITRSAASLLSRPVMPPPDEHPRPRRSSQQLLQQQQQSPLFGSRYGPNGWAEPQDDSTDTDGEEDREWGLEKDMKLFEVSAKDARGIQNLFDSLISAIIARREVIEQERFKRERDSVVLNGIAPAWDVVAEEEEARQRELEKASPRGWTSSCC